MAELVARGIGLERVNGIEPSYAAWEAAVLPLNYTRPRVADFSIGVGRETAHRLTSRA